MTTAKLCTKCGKQPGVWTTMTKGELLCEECHKTHAYLQSRINTNDGRDRYDYTLAVNDQLFFCGLPFRMDTYNGCSHGCRYCYVRTQELTANARKTHGNELLVGDENSIKNILVLALDTNKPRDGINVEWLRHRSPIHWGSMSDPFQACERKYRLTYRWMDALSWYKYPVAISTKGIIAMEPDYLKLLKAGNYAVQVSLISDDDTFLKALEPGAPSATDRMRLLATLADAGVWTAVRIQPVIPSSIVEERLPEFVARLAKCGVKHVMAEGYKIPAAATKETNDVWRLCPQASVNYKYADVQYSAFSTILPAWRKWKYAKVIRQVCHENGMTYGAADNDLRDLGDVVCCCGIDNIPGFEGFWRYQSSQAAFIAKKKGWVELADMQQFWHGDVGKMCVNSDSIRKAARTKLNSVAHTPKFAVDHMWNEGGENSPECMVSMKRDTLDGKLIYRWTDPVPALESNHGIQTTLF